MSERIGDLRDASERLVDGIGLDPCTERDGTGDGRVHVVDDHVEMDRRPVPRIRALRVLVARKEIDRHGRADELDEARAPGQASFTVLK